MKYIISTLISLSLLAAAEARVIFFRNYTGYPADNFQIKWEGLYGTTRYSIPSSATIPVQIPNDTTHFTVTLTFGTPRNPFIYSTPSTAISDGKIYTLGPLNYTQGSQLLTIS